MPGQHRCQCELLKDIFFVTLIPDMIQNPNSSEMLDWKRSVFIPIPKRGNAKECSNYRTIALLSHTSKVMLKILHDWLQQYVNCELPGVHLVLEKAEEPEIKLPISVGSLKKQENSRKTSTALLTMPKLLSVWITTNCGKSFKRWKYQITLPVS